MKGVYPRILLTLAFTASLLCMPAQAQIYRYQDENGKWHYTDQPPKKMEDKAELIDTSTHGSKSGSINEEIGDDLQQYLQNKLNPTTPIESSTLSVVKVVTALGSGSGFFIDSAGHILTNKHVVKPTKMEEFQNYGDKIEEDETQSKKQQTYLKQERKILRDSVTNETK